jgi:putative solute:sodium symporter small subunit
MNDGDNPAPDCEPDLHEPAIAASLRRYWASNVRIMTALVVAWLVVGLGCGVLVADWLNAYNLPGTGIPLGFWFAQQGSILGFVLIILFYCVRMNRLDRQHHTELEALREKQRGDA